METRDETPDFETYRESLGHEPQEVHPELASDLRSTIDGEVRFDKYTQLLYATDGSIYQALPAGVVFPTGIEDVQAAIRIAQTHDAPVLPRGAGSSLAGQTVGTDCIILDFSRHMDDILDVDTESRQAIVEPGVVQDDLDDHLSRWGLKFAPDPASSNRATIGGGIGNNSTGAHSVRYGITDEYTAELDVVLADGSLIHTREIEVDGDEWDTIVDKDDREAELYRTVRKLVAENDDEIESRYPTLKRSVSGYNLHKVVYERDGETYMNLSKLFVGAEGTLGVVVGATLDLVSRPKDTALALYCYDDLVSALSAVPDALEFDASAVELMDDEVFRLARESTEFAEYADPIPENAEAGLMLEFDSELHSDFEDAIAETNAHFVHAGDAFDVLEAYSDDDQARLWKLRKAAIPLLMSMEGDPKPYPFIEDASVPPEELAEYVREFMAILDDHDTTAAYFAHAGSGTLHIRPILNLKDADGIETMHSIAEDVTSLVLSHHGSFSGEHGDGLARTEFNPKLYGPQLWNAFKDLKTAFDPDWRLNPGKVVFRDDEADMREHLRYGPEYSSLELRTVQDFSDEGGFSHLVELCNGCGTCRQTGSETMCPSYRGMKDEMTTTRGRANLLRAAISGELPADELHTDQFQREVLDLCLGCKGCARDCPTGVDLAKLKAEVKHARHQKQGASLRDRFFAEAERVSALGSALAPISNWVTKLPGTGFFAEKTLGIAPERDLPRFASETFTEWFESRGAQIPPDIASERVLFVPDTFTNYSYPEPGKAAVRVLEAAGVHVQVPDDLSATGRAAYSEGFLDDAREKAQTNVSLLENRVDDGWSVVFVEPSDAVMFQDEYRDLLSDSAVETVASNTFSVCEFIDRNRLDDDIEFGAVDESLAYHGHCNQKAVRTDHHAVGVLRRAGYEVDPLDSGCCGMAGSFGYRTDQYDLSQAIGRILFEQVDESDAETVVAPGASCRTQFEGRGTRPPHPIEKVAAALHRS
ncbi:FAD-binding and (Fe-S)-binding domain-containing protein [Haladaptatus caseinilyticus]|uniref:FAD-binding and (Fe-S)-binding domain-containing protein n=1 Tax=Haladaptatus caseinilyticus TaxID=2993314 RepID=UPI00224ABB79|nr:FAD-binding and (Fe-S)-binding domain-containing protein [Haladaptatus caseinilyticus]